jgi:hypothetical protein
MMFTLNAVHGGNPDATSRTVPECLSIRKIPYPYRAMLAICSDLDETPDRQVYFETAKFLNTCQMTAMGAGVGLEVGNSIYFDMPGPQFSYWNTDDHGRGMIADCIHSGHIDCLHSYGDRATQRSHVERALGALTRNNCRLEVWIDHATAPSNFGRDIMRGRGDLPSAEIYHSDLSCQWGIQFVWLGRVTSIIGQDRSWNLSGIWNPKEKISSTATGLKEAVKWLTGALGRSKYAMHKANALIQETTLRDGRAVVEFMRFNPNWKGVSWGATADEIAEVLRPAILDRLVRREGISILYTHLGKIGGSSKIFKAATVSAFKTLARYSRDQKILVAATQRILKYRRAAGDLKVSCASAGDRFLIRLDSRYPEDLDGITVYTGQPEKSDLFINGRAVRHFHRNPADPSGRKSISLPWKKLEYPV